MASISNLQVGQILYDVHRTKCGNTTFTREAVFPVKVISIADDQRSIVASWNSNQPRKYNLRSVARWKVKPPTRRAK